MGVQILGTWTPLDIHVHINYVLHRFTQSPLQCRHFLRGHCLTRGIEHHHYTYKTTRESSDGECAAPGKVFGNIEAKSRETVHIKQDFGVLFIKVLQQLEKKNVHIKDFVFFLKDQALVFSSGTEMTDLTDVFDNVVHYCSWYNHHLLENIITAFSLDGEAYKRYCKDFREYCRHQICRLNLRRKNAFGSGDEHREPVMIKIDKHWSTVRLEELEDVPRICAEILEVTRPTLHLACAQLKMVAFN